MGEEIVASDCRVGGAVVVVNVDDGKNRSNFSMFSQICCRMAARSTGSCLGGAGRASGVREEGAGVKDVDVDCGGRVVVVVDSGSGKR